MSWTMVTPYQLERLREPASVSAVLLHTPTLAGLRDYLDRLKITTWPTIYPIAGGFVIERGSAMPTPPPALRLRSLAPNLFVPIDARLTPTLRADEAAALTRERGLVFFPGGQVYAFDPQKPLNVDQVLHLDLLTAVTVHPWPRITPLAKRLTQIERFWLPPENPEALLDKDIDDIGIFKPEAPESHPGRKFLGGVAVRTGKLLGGMGRMLGIGPLTRLGSHLANHGLQLAPGLAMSLLGAQSAALHALLKQFQNGNLEEALKRALPLGGSSGGRFSSLATRLPQHSGQFSLIDLLNFGRRRGGAAFYTDMDLYQQLIREYLRAAEQALARGDYRRAAFIHGRLLGDLRRAAQILTQGGYHHEAAILFRDKLDDLPRAAAEFAAARNYSEAIRLYEHLDDPLALGKLYQQLDEPAAALAAFHRAADKIIQRDGNYYQAGLLLCDHTGRLDLAEELIRTGWERRTNSLAGATHAMPCATWLAEVYALRSPTEELPNLLDAVEDWVGEPGHEEAACNFFNRIAELANLPQLADVRTDLRDRCRLNLARQLHHRAEAGIVLTSAVTAAFGRQGLWPVPLQRDAEEAFRQITGVHPSAGPRPSKRPVRMIKLGRGKVRAAVQARASGELFVALGGGLVAAYLPQTGETHHLSLTTYAEDGIDQLAVSPRGEMLVTLDWVLKPRYHCIRLTSFRRTGKGLFASPHSFDQPPLGEVRYWLFPELLPHPDRTFRTHLCTEVGRLNLLGYTLKGEPIQPAKAERDPSLLPPISWLVHDSEQIPCRFRDPNSSGSAQKPPLGWEPTHDDLPVIVPFSWLHSEPGLLELAGIERGVKLKFTALRLLEDTIEMDRNITSQRWRGIYAGVTHLAPSKLALVTINKRVHWLRAAVNNFIKFDDEVVLRHSAAPVGCFVSHETEELLVLFQDGTLACLPLPG